MMTDLLGEPQPAATPQIGAVLEELFEVLASRKDASPEDSYTAKLLLGAQDKLLKKIGEEASEVIIAARDHDAGQLRYEIGDLMYHVMVVMLREGLTLDDLAAELAQRRRT
ncbi:MAG: phosphoribosyl-ATP diphosphatase [Actinomycetia bacterium]|nr:phosphoribosyl-ATP diphosphatase [Actinomycetes bacterium]